MIRTMKENQEWGKGECQEVGELYFEGFGPKHIAKPGIGAKA